MLMLLDGVIIPFQSSLDVLVNAYPASTLVLDYNLCFDLRTDLIISRIRTVLLEAQLRIAEHIAPLEDPSLELMRMASLLREHAIKQCEDGLFSLPKLVSKARATATPCLEVELQLQYVGLLHYRGIVQDTAIPELEAEFRSLVKLCKAYPDTAGHLFAVVLEFRKFLSRPKELRGIPLPTIYTSRILETERMWRKYAVGSLTACENKHPYSTATFPNGCPDCGKEVKVEEEELKKYGKVLKEDRFLEWMNNIER